MNSPQPEWSGWQRIGLICAPLLAALVFFLPAPEGISDTGWYTLGVMIWMAVWWMTEAVPLAGTALLPLVLFPAFDISPFKQTAANYADPLIFLFFGGFVLARAIHVHQLDRRLAGLVLRNAGTRPEYIIAALMFVSAFLSMWVSNTATAMVMLPIALSVIAVVGNAQSQEETGFAPALLLGVAYAATIGGIGTVIGTPPNALFIAFLENQFGRHISFAEWMLVGMPVVFVLLPLTWLILTRVAFRLPVSIRPDIAVKIQSQIGLKKPMNNAEIMVLIILSGVVLLWLTRPILLGIFPGLVLSDAGVAIVGALLLFAIPIDFRNGKFLLSWQDVTSIRWDVLILFGGGLALASGIAQTDLASWGGNALQQLTSLPAFVFLICLGILVVLIGELASNTALAAILLPIAAAIAIETGAQPELLMLPITLFATLGFMLPVATPPNAIVFGSHSIRSSHMLRAGSMVDIVGILVVALLILLYGDIWLTAVVG